MKKQTLAAAIFLSVLNSSMALSAAPKVEEPPFEGYLFAYFEGRGDAKQQEHLRFALSDDGVNWRALNENRPVIASDTISESGGIRDPHILRGEDGRFYIVATDMNTAKNGWNENPGIVLLICCIGNTPRSICPKIIRNISVMLIGYGLLRPFTTTRPKNI